MLCLIGALPLTYKTWNSERSIARTQGTVVKTNTNSTIELKFSSSDGTSHSFLTQISSTRTYKVGRVLPVAYDIHDPEQARIDLPAPQPWAGPILLAVWGVILSLLGGVPLYFSTRKTNQSDWLMLNGRPIDAKFSGVIGNPNLIVNGKSPFRVGAQWTDPATGQFCQFMSDDIWDDPSSQITNHTIRVLVDPNNMKRYWMDLTFLTKP
jgi:hypothetical protein